MKQNVRLVAFLLAMVMLFVFSGCESAFLSTSGSTPTANSIPKTTPSDTEDGKAQIDAWIAQLVAATTEASDHYSAALEVLTNDFAAKPEGTDSPALEEMTQAMAAARDARVAALSAMVDDLNQLDSKDTDAAASKFAEAAALINHAHTYGERIYHSRNSEGINCAEADYYQICTLCNDLNWTKGEHQWYYSRNKDTHQMCCRVCDATEASSAHDTNGQGQCNVCNYKLKANILLIEGIEGEAQQLSAMMDAGHTVTTVNIKDSEKMPTTLEALQAYHEVILCNVANADMPDGFAELLQSYVRDYGGGLLTVGGDKAYQLEDMGGTTYEELLPVEMTVPSIAVMILVDVSGSMWNSADPSVPYEQSKLFAAVRGAEASLDELGVNDYVGVMSLADYYNTILELIPRTQRDKIMAAIADLPNQGPGGTIFSAALERAGQALKAMTNVDKKHIILITDGEPAEPDFEAYTYAMKQNAAQGITTSIVGIQCTRGAVARMTHVLKEYAGMSEKNFYDVQDLSQVSSAMRQDLTSSEIRGINCQRYMPSIVTENSITESLTVENMPVLGGAYYSKRKENATEVLSSPYGPLYAQWQYGKGMVGSFMCDLNGSWSENFLNVETGTTIIHNIISHLLNEKAEEEVPSTSPTVGNQVGDLCPSTQLCILTGDGISSQTIDPSALGKITIINFWGVWCGPCKAELPYFDQVASMFADQVTVVAVHSIISVSDGPEYIAEKYPNSKIIFAVDNQCDETDIVGIRGELFLALGFRDHYPATVILDENGVILYSSTECFLSLEELLAVLPESLFDDTVS